jgi:hypothetical protein
MFIQTIHGRTDQGDALRDQLDAWAQEHGAEAEGWLGTTAGVTDEGEFIAVVRFASAEAAQRNSDRPEQGEWWSETEGFFSGDVEFHDYPNADLLLGGGSDDAGFVQVIQSRTSDLDRLLELQRDFDKRLGEFRPEIIGGTYGWDDQGNVVETVYFTSEGEAREGERKLEDAPDDMRALFEEFLQLTSDPRYFDLRGSWLWSPPG